MHWAGGSRQEEPEPGAGKLSLCPNGTWGALAAPAPPGPVPEDNAWPAAPVSPGRCPGCVTSRLHGARRPCGAARVQPHGTMPVCSSALGPPRGGVPASGPAHHARLPTSASRHSWLMRGCPGTAGSNYSPSVGEGKGDLKGRFMSWLCGGGRGPSQLCHVTGCRCPRVPRSATRPGASSWTRWCRPIRVTTPASWRTSTGASTTRTSWMSWVSSWGSPRVPHPPQQPRVLRPVGTGTGSLRHSRSRAAEAEGSPDPVWGFLIVVDIIS